MTQSSENSAKPRRRTMSPWRWAALGALLLAALPAAGILVLVERFNPNHYAPQIIAAVDQATGRQLHLSGPLTLRRDDAHFLSAELRGPKYLHRYSHVPDAT